MSVPTAAPPASCAEVARRVDPDRFLACLFAPADRREALFVLVAFDHELVRAVEMPSARSGAGPIATLIRLQWWREVVEGGRQDWVGHEVAGPVRGLLEAGLATETDLLRIIAAREAQAEEDGSTGAWLASRRGSGGGLQRAIGTVLGVEPALASRLEAVGAAHAIGRTVRDLAARLRLGQRCVPDEMLAAIGSSREALLHGADAAVLAALRQALAAEGRTLLTEAGRIVLPRAQMAAVLPLVLAGRDLGRPGSDGGPRGIGDRLAVLRAWRRGAAP